MAVSYRLAIVAVVDMNATGPLIALATGAHGAKLEASSWVAALGTAFSIGFGTWVIGSIDKSAERAELIAQFKRTRAELAEVTREAGSLAERDRLASEIHDTIAQGFTSIVMLVQAAEAVIGDDTDRARKQLDLIARTARENLAEARALVAGVAPAALAAAPLADALARLADRAGEESGLRATFEVRGEPRRLGTGAEVVLLRVCQEALTNVRRHAGARSARVLLRPGGGGVDAIGKIRAGHEGDVRIIVLTTFDTDADILRAVEAGAAGYLLKDSPRADLLRAIRAAARGETVLAPVVAGRLMSRVRGPRPETLSARETEVLALVARGMTNFQIGRALFVSEATVKTHLTRACAKLGVTGRTAAVTKAMETGALPPPGTAS